MKTAKAQLRKVLPQMPGSLTNMHLDALLRPELRFESLPPRARARLAKFSDEAAFRARTRRPGEIVGVAEGDSWFDYLPAYFDLDFGNGDLLGELNEHPRLRIFKVAKAGDTLANMVFGPNGTGQQLAATLNAIRKHGARFFLFSGGGNDVAGPELERFLYPIETAPDPKFPVRKDVVEQQLGKVFTETFNHLIDQVRKVAKIPIFLHGYDYAIPDGRAVIRAPFGFHFVGPWLKPAFERKGHKDPAVQQRVIDALIDRLNLTVSQVAKQRASDGVHHINVRGVLVKSKPAYKKDWANELHPTSRGWRKVADVFEAAILPALRTTAPRAARVSAPARKRKRTKRA